MCLARGTISGTKHQTAYLITRTAPGESSTSRSMVLPMSRVAHVADHERSRGAVRMVLTAFIVSLVTLLSPSAQAEGRIRGSLLFPELFRCQPRALGHHLELGPGDLRLDLVDRPCEGREAAVGTRYHTLAPDDLGVTHKTLGDQL